MKKSLVCGAGGFIGSHLVKRLKESGHWVMGVDLKYPEFSATYADDFKQADLRDQTVCCDIFKLHFDEVYQLAADMGGAEYIGSGDYDSKVINNSVLINANVASFYNQYDKLFFSSSACIYPTYNQETTDTPVCVEGTEYPAFPDGEYGWEKLFSERMYLTQIRGYGKKIKIARFHNIFGPEGTWSGVKAKSMAAICRKVAQAKEGGTVDIFGDGKQTRTFLHINDCLDAVTLLMASSESGPFNIGSEEMVSINDLAYLVAKIAKKNIVIQHIAGPQGVRGRTSDNTLVFKKLGWKPKLSLHEGATDVYNWISEQLKKEKI
jgi:nucleoside-diphosphate-sugar epimerase